ncbi:hypothetical protein [Haladaptatus sp. DJG-WS-42]|uniref:hypothetical protein n=1 Tax=Haladaptatus sp. DJG-WS-42 TaxID=3120516 RepID=UPI0030CE30AE
MVSLETAFIVLVVLVPLAVILGSVILFSYVTTQYLQTRATVSHGSLSAVQERLDVLESARYITSGTIVDVREHSQRSKKWLFTGPAVSGIQVVIAVPTETETDTSLWFKTPEKLDGTSKFERFLAYCKVHPSEVEELLGKQVPVTLKDGEWQTNWITASRRREPIVSVSQVVSRLFGEEEEDVV